MALPIDLGIAIEGRWIYGLDAEDIPFLSRTAQNERDEVVAGKSKYDILTSNVKQLIFGQITFGVGPEIVNQLQLVQRYANGEISTAEYDQLSLESLGGFGFNMALLAVTAGSGRGRAGVIEEGAAEAAARRSPLRDTLGRVSERASQFSSRVGESLSGLNERFSGALDSYAARTQENVLNAIKNGRKGELGVLGEIPKSEAAAVVESVAIPGDANFVGPHQKSWILAEEGMGAHLVERSNVKGRPELQAFDEATTPRYYPEGGAANAGQAHLRLHAATRAEGISLKGGNPHLTDAQLLDAYGRAYARQELQGVRGALRTPNSSLVLGEGLTPSEAYAELLKWYSQLR